MKIFTLFLFASLALNAAAQRVMTLEECMAYAVDNSFKSQRAEIVTQNAIIDHNTAKLSFLPSLSASVGANASFGRGIDPQTNSYVNTSTFNNSIGVSSSMVLFDGLRLVNQLRRAKAAKLQGIANEEVAKDDVAHSTMTLYAEVLYYTQLVELHKKRIENFTLQERQILRKSELGQSSQADLAQIRASLAQEEYSAINATNSYEQSVIKLKDAMNFPLDDTLLVADDIAHTELENPDEVLDSVIATAKQSNPGAVASGYSLEQARHNLNIARSALIPSISLNGGISTSYFTHLGSGGYDNYGMQLRNNLGEYVGASLSIPIFARWQNRASISKSKNALRQAEADHSEKLRSLQSTITQVEMELNASQSAWEQAQKNVEYQQIATDAALKGWQNDKISIIELQTSQNDLLKSQIEEKYSYLKYQLKLREMNYYKGVPYVY